MKQHYGTYVIVIFNFCVLDMPHLYNFVLKHLKLALLHWICAWMPFIISDSVGNYKNCETKHALVDWIHGVDKKNSEVVISSSLLISSLSNDKDNCNRMAWNNGCF